MSALDFASSRCYDECVKAPHPSHTTPSKQQDFGAAAKLNSIEPNLADAALLISRLRNHLTERNNRRLLQAFTALADGDREIGILAFYLWRRNARRRT